MDMDANYNGYPDFNPMLPSSSQFPGTPNQYQVNQLSTDFDFLSHQFAMIPESGDLVRPVSVGETGESWHRGGNLLPVHSSDSGTVSTEVDSVSYDNETVFKFLNHILIEDEDIEPNHIMSYDPLDFRVTERSFYDILGQPYPMTPIKQSQRPKRSLFVDQANQQQLLYGYQIAESPDSSLSSSYVNASSSSRNGHSNSADSQFLSDYGSKKLSILQTPLPSDGVYKFNSSSNSNSQLFVPLRNSQSAFGDGMSEYSANQFLPKNICMGSESVLQFQRGIEEANKFLPRVNPLVMDLESSKVSADYSTSATITVKNENERMNACNMRKGRRNSPNVNGSTERTKSPISSKVRKNHEREDVGSDEERRSKQSATYKDVQDEEDELSELFDKVLLFKHDDNVDVPNEKSKSSKGIGQPQASNGGAKKQARKKETVDLRNLLLLCAEAVSTNDIRTSTELLKQIRHHSSPFGDGSQRLAHCFANGLEARMAGAPTRYQICYNTIASKQTTLEKLKIYELNISTSPIQILSIIFMNTMILEIAKNATTLHIVDFGIMYGFQWPSLIHKLSKRPGGPPKLRITGIEVPQNGFRPTEWIEDTGRRLAKYCARFNVPFEFNAIASQHWESIKVEDLKVERNEKLAVNCLLRFKNLLDETVEENSPRDSVLKLIRSLNPDIFVHSIINGAYNSPFFFPRFREALFFFSAVFESFDVNMPHSLERFYFETEFYGMEAMNVIACEGAERNERPETYKQWQVRTQRAGLKLLPLDSEITKTYRDQFKEKYHKDYKVEQGGDWLLQGWRGRIVYATSCWVPA